MTKLEKQLGLAVAFKRRKLGITQTALAKKVKMSRVMLTTLETGKKPVMARDALALMKCLNIKVSDL
jgi:transcriptional regulator with XRE-family HTH domain